MSITFDGDVVVITGAARGLGREYAELLAARGARVVVNDIGGAPDGSDDDAAAAEVAAAEISQAGGAAIADTNDGSTTAGAEAIIATAIEHFGRVDAVVANAGILRDAAFHHLADEDFDALMSVHLGGTMRVFRAAYPHMRDQRYGRLVATTSGAGLFGNFGQTAYAAAKMGIVGLTRTLAIEGASRDIKANVVAPGAATRLTQELLGDLAETLRPAAVAPLVACLCHTSLAHTGQVFSAAGGRFARVGIGVGQGVMADDTDALHELFDELVTDQSLVFPDNAVAETQLLLAALAQRT